jgi:hypothetical protein
MWKAQYSLSDRQAVLGTLYWAFHISERTVFKLSTLSFAYFHRFYHFITFVFIYKWKRKEKITLVFT